jgi:hypothetical protein
MRAMGVGRSWDAAAVFGAIRGSLFSWRIGAAGAGGGGALSRKNRKILSRKSGKFLRNRRALNRFVNDWLSLLRFR